MDRDDAFDLSSDELIFCSIFSMNGIGNPALIGSSLPSWQTSYEPSGYIRSYELVWWEVKPREKVNSKTSTNFFLIIGIFVIPLILLGIWLSLREKSTSKCTSPRS